MVGEPRRQQARPASRNSASCAMRPQKRANAIRVASERKASPKEACELFNAFSAAEVKMIKYATDNAASCGIPPEIDQA